MIDCMLVFILFSETHVGGMVPQVQDFSGKKSLESSAVACGALRKHTADMSFPDNSRFQM